MAIIINHHLYCHCGLVVSAPAWDGTGCEFDSWQCRIYCSKWGEYYEDLAVSRGLK